MEMRPKVLKKKNIIRMKNGSIREYKQSSLNSVDLRNKVEELSEQFFGDMLFKPGSITFDNIKKWEQEGKAIADLPEELQFFSYDCIEYKVADLPDYVGGYYDNTDGEREFCVSVTHENDEDLILHELIHLHEDVLSSFPFYRDVVFISLYWDLKAKIPDLDTMIRDYLTGWSKTELSDLGGENSVLFFLKSLDLDLRKGQELGTVFGYDLSGRHEHDQEDR